MRFYVATRLSRLTMLDPQVNFNFYFRLNLLMQLKMHVNKSSFRQLLITMIPPGIRHLVIANIIIKKI